MTELEIVPFERDGYKFSWIVDNGIPYLPIAYLSSLFDMEFKYANQIVTINSELFEGMVVKIEKTASMTSGSVTLPESRSSSFTCLTIAGVLQWLSRLDYKRYESERREVIIKTQRWLVETGAQVMMRNKIPAPEIKKLPSGIGDVFTQCISVTDIIEKKHHVDPILGTIMALQETQKITGHDMTGFQSLLPPTPVEDMAYLTPTDLADRLAMRNPREVNKMLEMMGMQVKQFPDSKKKGDWLPTEKGKPYCNAQTFRNAINNHSGYQLKWKESIIPVMEKWEMGHQNLFSY